MNQPKPNRPRPKDRYIDLSGPDQYGKPKAHVVLTYVERFTDGTSKILQEVTVSLKPILSIFRHAGYVHVKLDFLSPDDVDLAMMFNLLQDYEQPINSVDWLPEEVESGVYYGEDGEPHPIYFPTLELALSPARNELEYMLFGVNPMHYSLQPNGPKAQPTVLEFVFNEDWFSVREDLYGCVDLTTLRDEIMDELREEMAHRDQPELYEGEDIQP